MRGEREAETGLPFGTTAIAARAKVTAESLLDEAEQVRLGAMEYKQFNAANTAIKGKAVLTGHWVERAEIGKPGEFDALSDDELERMVIEGFKELSLTLDVDEKAGADHSAPDAGSETQG
jgi:hypothetical protein